MSDSFWEATYRQNIGKLIGVCCRYTQNRQIAEDLAHDAFLVAIDKVSSFESKGPFEAWLRRIAVNVALQYLREQKKQEKCGKAHAWRAVADDISNEDQVNDNHHFSEAELLEVIGILPEHHRLVFNLYVFDNFTHAQIASYLGISEGTSKSHLARARKKIRELLNEQLGNDRKRRRAHVWFILSYRIRPIDQLVTERLNNLTIRPRNALTVNGTNTPVPSFKTSSISYVTYLKTGVLTMATAVFLTGNPNISENDYREKIAPVNYTAPDSAGDKFSRPVPATISKIPVIVKKTKTSEPMKNLSTLAGIMVASLALDTVDLSTKLSNAFENYQITVDAAEKVTKQESVEPIAERRPDSQSGSFYASKLYWSAEDSKLYFLGNHVKVNLSRNKFTGSGKFSFLDKVSYLIVDGVAIKPDETITLQDKKYNLVSLDGSAAVRKYGENAKAGAVEITLADNKKE